MPAHVPPTPPSMGQSVRERMEAVQRSKTLVVRHAIISSALALFFIGFNAAFTRGFLWFPWPVAALIVLWLYHLHKYLEQAKGASQGFNAWLDDGSSAEGEAGRPINGARQEDVPGFDAEPPHQQRPLDFGEPSRRREREWLD